METERLEQVFEKTNGHCHLCGEKVYFSGYGSRNIALTILFKT